MLKSVFEAHDSVLTAVNSPSETKKKYSEMLLAISELEIVEGLVQLLLPFFQFTELMSGSKYVTISVFMPGVTMLLEILQLFESKFNNKFIEELSINMHDDLERRTTEYLTNPLVICASYLDTRYIKFKFIKDEKKRIEYLEKAKLYIKSTYFAKFKAANEVNELQPPNAERKRKSNEQNFKLCDENDETDNQVINETAELEMELHNYNKMTVHVSEHSNT
jgi:hypothetical protein